MAKKNKKGFRYWPQVLLGAAALSTLSLAGYFVFRHEKALPAKTAATPQKRPELRLPGLTLINFRNQEVVLNDIIPSDKTLLIIWATWCGPCVEEMKTMPKLLPQIKAKGYSTIFINYDPPEKKDVAEKFAKKYGVETAFEFKGELLYSMGLSALPVSLIVDKSGKVLRTIRGEIIISQLQ